MVREQDDGELTAAEIAAVVSLTNRIWPSADKTVSQLIGEFPEKRRRYGIDAPENTRPSIRTLVWEGEDLVAHALSFERTVISAGVEISVMALSSVCVTPGHRGRGLGAEIVRRAFQRVDHGEFPVSLFQTAVPEFYRRLGATPVSNRFVNSRDRSAPDANPWEDEWIIIYPADFAWPEGEIDLNGPGY